MIKVVLNLDGVNKWYNLAEHDKIKYVVTVDNICAITVPIPIFLSTNSKWNARTIELFFSYTYLIPCNHSILSQKLNILVRINQYTLFISISFYKSF
jgi:hypothetical protein